jgi:hypothetical protein
MITKQQSGEFALSVLSGLQSGGFILVHCIAWMRLNLKPSDVFAEEQLVRWAHENNFIKTE